MYCSHFGLQRLPFNNTPDPAFYYSTPDHEEALATLQYATQQRKGFVLVSGEIGAGKTLIGRIFLRQLDANATTAVISQTNLTGRQLLAAICTEFGLPAPADASNLELTQRLQDFLVDQFARNRHVVVLLDEAQNLPDESFEELRMLGNLEADDAKLLQVCILGQPELRARFSRPGMKQLEQRLFRRFHLPSLNATQTGEYIIHRLGVAGCRNEQLFTPEAIERIYRASGGIPRLINQICDNALLTAYGQDAKTVDAAIIDQVVERDGGFSLQTAEAQQNESLDSVRLAELALAQTESLCGEVAALTASGEPLRSELEKISERQAELHKIVAGATTRWLSAKEKLEAYRREIQNEIQEVIERCQRTQERLEALERTAAPAEDLDEIRENHLRETNRLLKLMQAQRDAFAERLDEVYRQWVTSEQELRRLAQEARADERFNRLQEQCASAGREVLSAVDQHRQSMLEHLTALRQQCDAAQRQLQNVEAMFDRRVSEADRRVEQLRNDQAAHEKELTALREQLEGWRRALGQSLESLKSQVADVTGEAREKVAHRDLEELRCEHVAAAEELRRRIGEQSEALHSFRKSIEEVSAQSDLLHRRAIEQIASRTAELEARLAESREALAAAQETWQRELVALADRYTQRLGEQDSRLEALTSGQAAMQGRLDDLDAARTTLTGGLEQVRGQLEAAEGQIASLASFREQQIQATALLLRQLDDQRRGMRAEFDALAGLCRSLESGLEQLRGTATNEAIEAVRQQHAADMERLAAMLAAQEQQLQRLARRVHEEAAAVAGRLDTMLQDAARAGEASLLRETLQAQVEQLSAELNACQRQWSQAFEASREGADRFAAELLRLARASASRDDLAAIRAQQQETAEALRREMDQHQADHAAGLAKVAETLESQIEQIRTHTIGQIEKIQSRQRELQEEVRQALEACITRQQEVVADLSARWEALRASLDQLARDSVPHETLRRVEASLTAGLSELRDHVADTASEQTQVLRTLVEKLEETAARVTTLEEMPPRTIQLQPEVAVSLGRLVEAAESQRESLNQALERAGAITAHFRNCSAQVQEIMEHWMSHAGAVREESAGLMASAQNAREILEAMRKCNAALDAKLNSPRWRSELERGEALAARIEQAVSSAQTVVRRLEAALAEFDTARTQIDVWEQRQKEAQATAGRLAELLDQAQARQRLLSAVARNTSQLVEVIEAARLEDERRSPTPAIREPITEKTGANGHAGPRVSRLRWPTAREAVASRH